MILSNFEAKNEQASLPIKPEDPVIKQMVIEYGNLVGNHDFYITSAQRLGLKDKVYFKSGLSCFSLVFIQV